MRRTVTLFITFLTAIAGFIPVACADCHARVGYPFPYYDTGGFLHGDHILWLGQADLTVLPGPRIRSSVRLGTLAFCEGAVLAQF